MPFGFRCFPVRSVSVRFDEARRSFILVVLAAAALGCGSGREARSPTVPSGLPTEPVLALDGTRTSLVQLAQGRVTIIELWATWCAACKKNLAELDVLSRTYAADGLFVAGVNVGEEANAVLTFIQRQGLSYAVYLDPEFVWADVLGEKRLPRILVLDRRGAIVHRSSKVDRATRNAVGRLLGESAQR